MREENMAVSNLNSDSKNIYDFIIIGSGFGGSVSALRLAQKGYKVLVLEEGKRWRAEDFPHSNWNAKKYLWFPLLRCFGIQKISLLKGVMVLHGAGLGGGSLVYANTLMKPHSDVFEAKGWPSHINWEAELEPHYNEAKKMLGVTTNPMIFSAEQALKGVGEKMNVGQTFHPTEVAIYFGEKDKIVPDPYFGGRGPARSGCNGCGGCMVGCRYLAKNTLDLNYLYLAEKLGVQIQTEASATKILKTESGYCVETKHTTAWLKNQTTKFFSRKVIVAAGVLGTVKLLLSNRDQYKILPNLSSALGENVRTNGESLLGATSFDLKKNMSEGIAIGAAIHPDKYTKIEAVKYPNGSGFMRLLGVPLTSDGSFFVRPLKMILNSFLRSHRLLRLWAIKDWARSTIILLVMQSIDQKMRLSWGRSLQTGFKKGMVGTTTGGKLPSYMPVAQEAAKKLAIEINGEPQNVISEVLLKTPATAHILGGCCMSESEREGVIDYNHEVFNYPGLYVCDGSVVPANLGVNPSLTIAALAERFASKFPERG